LLKQISVACNQTFPHEMVSRFANVLMTSFEVSHGLCLIIQTDRNHLINISNSMAPIRNVANC